MTSEKEASYASVREKKSDSREITGREKGKVKGAATGWHTF